MDSVGFKAGRLHEQAMGPTCLDGSEVRENPKRMEGRRVWGTPERREAAASWVFG